MKSAINTPQIINGCVVNLLGKELRIHDTNKGVLIFSPSEGAPAPRVSWEEWDKTAGFHLVHEQHSEHSLSLLPGYTVVGLFNGLIQLVRPISSQRTHLRSFWRKCVDFQHGRVYNLPNIDAINKCAQYYPHIIASSGPDTAVHYASPVPAPNCKAPAYAIMDSGFVMTAYYSGNLAMNLDYVLVPARYPDLVDDTADYREADALIPAKLLLLSSPRARRASDL